MRDAFMLTGLLDAHAEFPRQQLQRIYEAETLRHASMSWPKQLPSNTCLRQGLLGAPGLQLAATSWHKHCLTNMHPLSWATEDPGEKGTYAGQPVTIVNMALLGVSSGTGLLE